MAGMWCPSCRSEYREGFTECADCGVALVGELPPAPSTARVPSGPPRPDDAADDAVELVRVMPGEAELLASLLGEAGIQAYVQDVWAGGELIALRYSEGLRVMVRRGDLAAAQAVLADFEAAGGRNADIEVPDLDAQAEAATDWSDPSSGAVV